MAQLPDAARIGGMGVLMVAVAVMLLTGSTNTVLMKFMVLQEVTTGTGMPPQYFHQPYFQTMLMMIGEFLCLIAFYATTSREDVKKVQEVPNHIFMVACVLDWTATTLVNFAYVFIAASVAQMTRGSIVIFTCLLSVTFLGRKQQPYHIAGVVLVFVGITLVSLSTFFNPAAAHGDHPARSGTTQMFGIGLCISAQVFQASMLVYEEKIMSQYNVPPLRLVGMEGFFGILIGGIVLSALNAFSVESTPAAIYQLTHSTPLLIAAVGSIFSIAFFNFAGVTVTQQASAVARSTIDVSRTILIWAVELAFGWNSFNVLQLIGFVVLAAGTMLYNRLIVLPMLEPRGEAEALVMGLKKLGAGPAAKASDP
mmetsp:Transcript_52423/g.148429  ORF Transcript_52423/g.148429 Transcript_52423/m.148429 type:complete len:367 (+) Transcript_52423:61-1161(+)